VVSAQVSKEMLCLHQWVKWDVVVCFPIARVGCGMWPNKKVGGVCLVTRAGCAPVTRMGWGVCPSN
jgi:hypothetical protein